MQALVILPTYNEARNITAVLDGVLTHKNLSVLVVDDSSPDGTADLVLNHPQFGKRISLLSGEKKGLGAAYKRGFLQALQSDADVFIQMDADGSHDPADIPRLLAALTQADVAIGSRYVSGGQIEGWGLHRKIISFCGNLFARTTAGLWKVRDCTAGFRAITRKTANAIDWKSLPVQGYAFQIVLLSYALRKGAVITELPVTFVDRARGRSKLGFSDITEFFVVSLRLGLETYARLLKFLLVGASGLIVNLGLFSLLFRIADVGVWVSWAIALEASIVWNFLFHDRWTFVDRKTSSWLLRVLKYHALTIGGVVLNFFLFGFLITYTLVVEEVANVAAIVLATGWNFTLSYFWAWSKKKNKKIKN